MDKRTLDLAAYAASGMSPEEYRATGGFRNVLGDFGADLSTKLTNYAKASKILQEKQNQKIANYMKGLNAEVDITSLDSSQQQAATDFLIAQKRTYADAAMEITNYDATDDRYLELISIMNGVNNKVKNFAGQVDSFNNMKMQFVQDVDSGLISEGNDVGQFAVTTNALTNNSNFLVDESGNVAFSDELGEIDLFKDLPSYFKKDFDTATKLTNLMDTVYSAGQTIDGNKENMLRMQLKNMISQGGRATLLSLANDDFFVEGGMGLQDPRLYEEENEAELKETVINGYLQALKDTAAEGARKASKNNKAQRVTTQQRQLQQMENLLVNSEESIVNGINTLLPQIQSGEVNFNNLYDLGTNLGLDVNKVTNDDDDIIGYRFEHPMIKQKVEISVNGIKDPFLIQKALYRALGSDYLGYNITRPEPENTEETESDLPIIE